MPAYEALNGGIEELVGTFSKSLSSNPRAAPGPHRFITIAPSSQFHAASPCWPQCLLPLSCLLVQACTAPVLKMGSLTPSDTTALSSANFPPSQCTSRIRLPWDLPPPPSLLFLSLDSSSSIFLECCWSWRCPATASRARCCRDAHMERMRCPPPRPGHREDNDLSASFPGHDEKQ